MSPIERINSVDALDGALAKDASGPVWVFKHSLTCPVSDAGFREFERYVEAAPAGSARFLLIEIQRARPVSAEVAERLGVRHESPQAILLRDGEVAWHASHWQITSDALQKAIAS